MHIIQHKTRGPSSLRPIIDETGVKRPTTFQESETLRRLTGIFILPPSPPDPIIAFEEAMRKAAARAAKRRRLVRSEGRRSTFSTSPFGLRTEANVRKKKLLGE